MSVDKSQPIEIYKLLFDAGLLEHIGSNGKPVTQLPDGINNGTSKISQLQNDRLRAAIDRVLTHINDAGEENIWDLPNYNGSNPVDLVGQILAYADSDGKKDAADLARKKIQSAAGNAGEPPSTQDNETGEQNKDIPDTEAELPVKREEEIPPSEQGDSTRSSLQEPTHPNLHTTSTSGGLKFSNHQNNSIASTWAQGGCIALQILDDDHRTCVLFEIKTIKPQPKNSKSKEYISRYGVERYDAEMKKYYVTIVNKNQIGSSTADDWNNIKGNKLIHVPSDQKKQENEDYGELTQFYFSCYQVPKLRQAGKAKRTPPLYSCIRTSKKEGFQLVVLSDFERIEPKAEKYVQNFYKIIGRPTPWDTRSQSVRVIDGDCHEPQEGRTRSGAIVQVPRSKSSSNNDPGQESTGMDKDDIRALIKQEVTKHNGNIEERLRAVEKNIEYMTRILEKFA